MVAYDQRMLEKFILKAADKGISKIEVIIAQYEEDIIWGNRKIYHNNIMLRAGKMKKSLYDYDSLDSYAEKEETASEDAKTVAKTILEKGLRPTLKKVQTAYSWFWDAPKLN